MNSDFENVVPMYFSDGGFAITQTPSILSKYFHKKDNMKYWSLFIFLLLSWNQVTARDHEIYFRTVSPQGGLTSEAVNKIIQDAYGYIWINTNHGLIRYNSKTFERFSYEQENKNGLPRGLITDFVVDHENVLWISTYYGLLTFDYSTQTFIPYKIDNKKISKTTIYNITCDKKGNLWIIDSAGMAILYTKEHKITRLTPPNKEKPITIHCNKQGNVWIGTKKGSVYKINPESLSMKQIIKGKGEQITLFTEGNKLWIASNTHGLKQYTTQGKFLKKYNFNNAYGHKLKNWDVRKVIKDHTGRLWIATYQGLFCEFSDGTLKWFDTEKDQGIPHSSIYDIYEDRQHGIWLGTWAGGLSYLNHANNRFLNYSHSQNPHSLSNNLVSSFVQDHKGNIFVGTEKGGLNLFNKKKKTFTTISLSKGIANLNIKCQCIDKEGGHWVGTHGHGLFYKKAGEKQYRQFTKGNEDGKHISFNNIYSVFPVKSGVWIGTHGGGINFYDHSTGSISFYSSLFPNGPKLCYPYVKSIIVDSYSNLWVGTVNGFQRISLKGNYGLEINDTSQDHIFKNYTYTITQVSDGNIWIGTRSAGIYIYNYNTGSFTSFNANGLLKNKVIFGILEDLNDNIWITSNDGLIQHNPKTKTSRRFDISDGLQGRWFNSQSIFKDANNDLYFGGTNGFSMISPENIKFNTTPPEVIVNKLTINNKQSVLYPYATNTDSLVKTIQLDPNETNLRFEFTSNNYLLPEKNRFKYRLVNYYDEWIEADKDATALFANLKWGTYTFEVKGCNNDGVWSIVPARIYITISKPFYATNLAISIYILLFLLILYYIIQAIKIHAKLENEVYLEKVERKQLEQLNEMKLKFFTNISHEFRTPLTLISGPVKALKQENTLSSHQKEMVDIIHRNSSRLLILINQVLDFRKMEKGKENLKFKNSDIISFVKERVKNFSFNAQQKSIHLIQEFPDTPIMMDFDAEKMEYIIYNLLSNAFKNTLPGGTITISMCDKEPTATDSYSNHLSFGQLATDNIVSIRVIDSGSGIDSDDLPKIFDRFEQGNKHQKDSSGIGLSMCREFTLLHQGSITTHSTPGQGSCFVVQLPIKHYAEQIFPVSHNEIKIIDSQQEQPVSKNIIEKDKETRELTILLVEDNMDMQKHITMILDPLYTLKTANNGQQGLQILKNNTVDIILSDVMMPIMNGYEFCSTVKSDISTCHIPIILLTALSTTENKIAGMRQGADAYIVKPFDDTLLITQITNLLQQRQKLREHFAPKHFTEQMVEMEGLDNYFLKKLNQIIENHIGDEELNIDRLTELVGLSRSQLHRKLKSLTNYSTSEYVRTFRLEKAIKLMQTGQYNIDEIAHVVGFNTHSYFSRCFKQHFNQSPKEYLKTLKDKRG